MWPWFTSAAYQRLLIRFNLTAMPRSYFLPLSLSLPSSAHPDVPTYFCTPPCLGSPPPSPPQPLPTLHHPLQLDPHIQPELRCFNPLSVLPSSSHSHWDAECELLSAPSSPFTQPHTSATAEILSRRRPLFLFNCLVTAAGWKVINVEHHYSNELRNLFWLATVY